MVLSLATFRIYIDIVNFPTDRAFVFMIYQHNLYLFLAVGDQSGLIFGHQVLSYV